MNTRFPNGRPLGCMVAALAIGFTGTAAADIPGFYMTGTVGQSTSDLGSEYQAAFDDLMVFAWNEAGLDVVDADSGLDKTGFGYEIAVGYQFSPYLAVEGAYIDLGDATYDSDGTVTDGADDYPFDAQIAVGNKGPALSLVGTLPVGNDFWLDARVGALFGKTALRIKLGLDGVNESQSESDSKTSMLYGIGAGWSFSPRTAVRLGYTLFDKAVLQEENASRVSLGFRYAF